MFSDLSEYEQNRINEEMYKSYMSLFTINELNEGYHIIPLKGAIEYINAENFDKCSSRQKYGYMREICATYNSSVLNFVWINVNFNKDVGEYFQYLIDEYLEKLDENFKKYFTNEELINKKYEKLIARVREIEAKQLNDSDFRNEMYGLDSEFPTFKQHIRIIIACFINYEDTSGLFIV